MSSVAFREDIQGLRAIAVLAVIAFHFNPALLPGGFVGVDIFLVISGFLITSILLKQKNNPEHHFFGTLKYFWISRSRRIIPAYMTVLAVVALVSAVLFLPQDFGVLKEGLKKAAYFNSNNYFASFGDYFAPANHEQPLLHTWSLAVEVQFYLLAPLLILVVPNRALVPLLVIFSIGISLLAEYRLRILGIEKATYYSFYARLPEFFIGALAGVYLAKKEPIQSNAAQVLGLVGMFIAITYQPKLGPFPGLLALLPAMATGLVLITRPTPAASKLISRILCNKPLLWLGTVSFSLYLWHWPVLAFLRYYTGVEVLNIGYSALFVLLTIFLTVASYYWVEVPLRSTPSARITKSRRRARKVGFWVGYAGIAAMMAGTAWGAAKVNGYFTPSPLPLAYTRYADAASICHGQVVGECFKGDLASSKEILVLGDSHAAMLNHFFDQLGKEQGFKARIITASSCVTIPDFDVQRIPESARQPCIAQIAYAKKYLESAKTVFLAASWDWQLESTAFQDAVQSFLKNQNMDGKKIYLMEQEPRLNRNPQRLLRFSSLGLDPEIAIDPEYRWANSWLRQTAVNLPNVTSLNFEDTGLFAQVPFYEGELIYMDEHHLNEIGAKRYGVAASRVLKKIMN